ncbi:hypothetical protein KUC_1166 [Vreelandella boliviensis LC1]|uniref:Uncharacterized protein n=1 Tax=Vreelandella boliviensis LC1 TaxID=1072583 RepID=A0A7U9C2Z5_9GAMM|nr:hypothetical protein KUC_1166 [Halomonas boliviensis LC1]
MPRCARNDTQSNPLDCRAALAMTPPRSPRFARDDMWRVLAVARACHGEELATKQSHARGGCSPRDCRAALAMTPKATPRLLRSEKPAWSEVCYLTLTCGFLAFYVRMHSSRRNAHDSDALGTVTFPTSSSRSTLNKHA